MKRCDTLGRLLDLIDRIERDDDGDAMLDAEGLTELKTLAQELRSPVRFEPTPKAPGDVII